MIDQQKLAVAVRAKRGSLSLRKAARVSGIDFATMSRIERGIQCDLDTFARITEWIGVPMDYFRKEETAGG